MEWSVSVFIMSPYTPYLVALCVSILLLALILCRAKSLSGIWGCKVNKAAIPAPQSFTPPQIPAAQRGTLYPNPALYHYLAPAGRHRKDPPAVLVGEALKNRPGDVAADFTYTLSSGRRSRLHALHALKAQYTILFFNNPDCHDCQRVKEYMVASPVIERQAKAQNEFGAGLVILAVYPDGDISLWKQAEYPAGVINTMMPGRSSPKSSSTT